MCIKRYFTFCVYYFSGRLWGFLVRQTLSELHQFSIPLAMLAKYERDPAPRFNHQTPFLRLLSAVAALRAGGVMLARRRRCNAREH
jgi:hypothetical protein